MSAISPQPEKLAFLPYSLPSIGEDEIQEVVATLRSGWLTTGPLTARFESAFREQVGGAGALATSSCTAALHLALCALGVGPGDVVLTSPFTFAATANVVMHCGAEVVFLDIDPDTYNINPSAVASFLGAHCQPGPRDPSGRPVTVTRAGGRRVKALIAVHYGGQSCAMDELDALGSEYGFDVVEDAAHAAGSRYRGRAVGTLGRAGCFSFYPTKNLTTGEGGMLTSRDPDLLVRARLLSQHGLTRGGWQRYSGPGNWRYDVEEAGYKYNMTDLQAALGLHQLRRLGGFLARRRELAARYTRAWSHRADLRLPKEIPGSTPSYHLYPVQIRSPRIGRDRFLEELARFGIGSSVHFLPLHLTSFYRPRGSTPPEGCPVAERVFERIVSLPLYPALSDEQADRVIASVETILDGQCPA